MGYSFSTADLCDAYADFCQSCQTQFVQYGARKLFFGQIQTVECIKDSALIRKLFEQQTEGDVLVVDGGGYLGAALIGDMIASLGVKNGWSGIVIYGAIRDADAVGALDLGVKALGTNPRRSEKNGTGRANVPVAFGNVTFAPGHWIYSDNDGILISSNKLAF